jgi:rhodanese-related sulfurtransferase
MKRTVFFTFILSAMLLVACSTSAAPAGEIVGKTVSVDGGSYTDVSAVELQTMLAGKDFTFVNVHIPFAGDIPDTDISIPFDQIDAYQDQLPADKAAKIVIYCRSGSMSGVSAQTLVNMGYTNVWNLSGGFNAWQRAGFELDPQ